MFSFFLLQIGKIKIEGALLKIFLWRLFFVVLARICLHFGYDFLDFVEEFVEATFYFFFIPKKLYVLYVESYYYPHWARRIGGGYGWVFETAIYFFLFGKFFPWVIDKIERLFFLPFSAKTSLTGWYNTDLIEDDVERKMLKETSSLRKIEYITKYREERLKMYFLKFGLLNSLYQRGAVVYGKNRVSVWFFRRSNAFFRQYRFVKGKPSSRPNFYAFLFTEIPKFLGEKYNNWKVTRRRV